MFKSLSIILLLNCFLSNLSLNFLETNNNIAPWDKYDYYVFALQWGDTLCKTKGSACYEKLKIIPKHNLSLHGLWPSVKKGGQLPACNNSTTIEVIDDGTGPFIKMRQYWPSLTGPNKSFWEHEYNKHGYCYNKRYKQDTSKPAIYLQKSIEIYFKHKLNTLIIDTFGDRTGEVGFTYTEFMEKLQEKLGGKYFVPTCTKVGGKFYLSELRFMIGLDFNFISDAKLSGSCSTKKQIYINFWN